MSERARYAILLSGGVGTRFWPLSRTNCPKQFLDIFGGESLLKKTVSRVSDFMDPGRVLLVTNRNQAPWVEKCLPDFPGDNVLLEPEVKDTALAIGYACARVALEDPNAQVAVLPSDHWIENTTGFETVLQAAFTLTATPGRIVTVGMPVTWPSTGYGYLQRGALLQSAGVSAFQVQSFKEKPDLPTARQYMETGEYYFNGGLFIGRVDAFLLALEKHAPALYTLLQGLQQFIGKAGEGEALENAYRQAEKISFDYAVMEKLEDVVVVEANFEWDDVGAWDAYDRFHEADENGNRAEGEVKWMDSQGCTVVGMENHLLACLGLQDILVVHTGDATLLCPKSRVGEIRELVRQLRQDGREKFL